MKNLAIVTATNAISLAVTEENKIIGELFLNHSRTLSENLTFYIKELLEKTEINKDQIDSITVCEGPGAFMGLRVGMTTAKIFAQLKNLPIVCIDALDIVANNCKINGTIIVIQKACRNEMNMAIFGSNNFDVFRQSENVALTIDKIADKLSESKGPIYLSGDGADQIYHLIKEKTECYLAPPDCWEPKASVASIMGQKLINAGTTNNILTISPSYSHPPNIRLKKYAHNKNIKK